MLKSHVLNKETGKYDILVDTMVGRSLFARRETVQVMSDIWEDHLVVHSIDEKGYIRKTSVCGWYGQLPEDGIEYELDVTEEAYTDYRNQRARFHFNRIMDHAINEAYDTTVKDRVVQIVRGRNGKGQVGRVVVVMEGYYNAGPYNGRDAYKLGIALSPEKVIVEKNGREYENYKDVVWAWHFNCKVENPVLPNEADVLVTAEHLADKDLATLRADAARYAPKLAA